MLFIWNGKKSTAFLRSISLMKAFDLDKALMNTSLVHYIYTGYYFNDNGKTPPSNIGCINLGDIIKNTIENSEDTSNPSTDKINNLHETVYLFKLLYPNKKHKSKNKTKKNKNENQNDKSRNNNQNILFKGFVNEFLLCGTKKSFYDNFTEIELSTSSSNNNISLNLGNLNEKNYYEGFSENFINNNNLEKSNLSNSVNKKVVMPPKLNLNINLNIANKINSIGSVEDTSGSKRSVGALTSKEENKNNNINIGSSNSNNVLPNVGNKLNINLKNDNKENNNEEDDFLEEDEDDLDLIPYNDVLINKEKEKLALKKIRIPKLMVSLQKNVLNEEKLTERAKMKSEEEENLNLLPESTLISTSQHIINKMNNLGMNKINLPGLNQLNNNQPNTNNNTNNKNNTPENENQEEINIKALNEDYSLKDSERKKIISEYYSKHLSEIIPNFLYISSYNDFCENVFESENKYTYLSFYLKDHVLENIECIFYECIKFIENVKEKGGRVLVHCIQGISRSVTLVMAYLIYKNKLTYDKAFNIVQSKREISSPNFGFSIQLQNFYLRLYESPSKYRYIPKIFAVGSFQNEQPEKIVCRLMNEPFYEHKENGIPRMLDKRGIYTNTLKEYEHAIVGENGPVYVYDGKETPEFINDLLKTKEKIERFKNKISDIFPEWNSWYKEVKIEGNKNNLEDKNNEGNSNDNNYDSKSNSGNTNEIKKGFFIYPNDKPDAVLDLDDLNDETFLVACIYQVNKPKIFIWKGKFVDINENVYEEYKNKIKKIYFEQYNLSEEEFNKIECVNEIPLEESDEFLSFI